MPAREIGRSKHSSRVYTRSAREAGPGVGWSETTLFPRNEVGSETVPGIKRMCHNKLRLFSGQYTYTQDTESCYFPTLIATRAATIHSVAATQEENKL